MLNRNLALVADTKKITPSQLTKVAAALQKQATRDFGPLWDIQANVSGFASLQHVPTHYCPVIVRYSYSGAVKVPRTILQGGYLTWGVPETNEWFQMIWFDTAKPVFRSLGVLSGTGSLRATIDRLTPTPLKTTKLPPESPLRAAARDAFQEVGDSSVGRAEFLRKQIEEIKKAK